MLLKNKAENLILQRLKQFLAEKNKSKGKKKTVSKIKVYYNNSDNSKGNNTINNKELRIGTKCI